MTTITARWADLEPGTVVDREVHEAVLDGREAVEAFVDRLARPDASEARLVHSGRSPRVSPVTGRAQHDHQVIVGVHAGFGYVEYTDPEHFCQMVGDPASPEWHTTTSGHFHKGSGVSLDTLTDVVTEFLATAVLPHGVQWWEYDDWHAVSR